MYHKDPETGSARIVGFEVTPNRYCSFSLRLTVKGVVHSNVGVTWMNLIGFYNYIFVLCL